MRNASSRSRVARVAWSNRVSMKIDVSGLNQTVVPVPFALPMTSSFFFVSPRSNAMW